MKYYRFSLIASIVFFLSIAPGNELFSENEKEPAVIFTQQRDSFAKIWDSIPQKQRRGYKPFKRWEYFWERRLRPDGTLPSPGDLVGLFNKFQEESKNRNDILETGPEWKLLGPVGNPINLTKEKDIGVGRINVLRIDPMNPNIYWAGSAAGGVWRSTNRGESWNCLTQTQFMSMGVSDIAISPINSSVVYVATGDADGVGAAGGSSYSVGLIKTSDNGETWKATTAAYEFKEQRVISKILIHPKNDSIIYLATSFGIYKSTNACSTWTRISEAMFFRDLKFKIDNPETIIASTQVRSGKCLVLLSENGGKTWKETLSNLLWSRAVFALTPANPNFIALISAEQSGVFHSVHVSTDFGKTWKQTFSKLQKNLLGWDMGDWDDKRSGQGWYDLCLAVNPKNQNEILAGGVNIWKSTDGGNNWSLFTHWNGAYDKPFVHADHHDLFYDEASSCIISCNDGGIDRSGDGGITWETLNSGLSITQFYKLSESVRDTNIFYAGNQDNGTMRYSYGYWLKVFGADGMNCAQNRQEPNISFVSAQNGYFFRSDNNKDYEIIMSPDEVNELSSWVAPFAMAPSNNNILYVGYENVWRSSDGGKFWKKTSPLKNDYTLLNLKVSRTNSDIVYATTHDKVWRSSDGGQTWVYLFQAHRDLGRLTGIEIHPDSSDIFWYTMSSFIDKFKVVQCKIDKQNNISYNLPNVPVNDIVYHNTPPHGRLYIATDYGVYFSDPLTPKKWTRYGTGLPNTIVNDIFVVEESNKLRAATYGRGVWEVPLDNCPDYNPRISFNGKTALCDGEISQLEISGDIFEIKWSNGDSTNKINAKTSGKYWAIVTLKPGCVYYSDTVSLNFKAIQKVKISAKPQTYLCEDNYKIILEANIGLYNYKWSTGSTGLSINVEQAGKYWISAISDGCITSDTINIKLEAKPPKPNIVRISATELLTDKANHYNWFKNDIVIGNAQQQTYKMTSPGVYKARVFNLAMCSNTSDPIDIISDVDVISSKGIFEISPNPATDFIEISYPSESSKLSEGLEIRIFDVFGREQFLSPAGGGEGGGSSSSSSQYSLRIDVSNLMPGLYFVRVGGKVGKFLKI